MLPAAAALAGERNSDGCGWASNRKMGLLRAALAERGDRAPKVMWRPAIRMQSEERGERRGLRGKRSNDHLASSAGRGGGGRQVGWRGRLTNQTASGACFAQPARQSSDSGHQKRRIQGIRRNRNTLAEKREDSRLLCQRRVNFIGNK